MKVVLKPVAIYFTVSFLLHLSWYVLQAPLFANYDSGWESFKRCLFATATGDMFFMAVIYLSISAAFADVRWIPRRELLRHPGPWILSVIIGVLLGLCFELWAIHVEERWSYGRMPIMPILNVGLTPILQMIFIPLAIIPIASELSRRVPRNKF